ncbi:feruloyl esterase [Steroidobacter agaridevorans]|uniref:Feruloyl esterase n=1 Tax=Steroidobacter agaridevorans TaxID=2695856 RepID=A0A829YLL6_9GAMM|nr:tannase/feruloyl esterase family alpha/beta hydrolase [Steroidobacter agaridevorans]GFE83722.1 feruloyl esterase [Steroidobacter agaridevorans]
MAAIRAGWLVIAVIHGLAVLRSPAVAGAITGCEAIADKDFSAVPDAPTEITEATLSDSKDRNPQHCRVRGYVAPQVGFEIRLPSDWNGKVLFIGCAGSCGTLLSEQGVCDRYLPKGYACLVSDMGHKGSGLMWAYNNLQAEIDFAHRGTHVATLAAKAIIERFYGRKARKSYFMGCSTGGRQGLIAAQRFPWDFDGIVAGAPIVDTTAHNLYHLWVARVAAQNGQTRDLLTAPAIELIHNAAIRSCDLDDGVKDEIISDPMSCSFHPSELVCTAKAQKNCLTRAQVEVSTKMYAGVITESGEQLQPGVTAGSERYWTALMTPERVNTIFDRFRYSTFIPDPGPTWNAADFNFNDDYKRLGNIGPLLSASNPDLRRFKSAGGKLITYAGWDDVYVSPAKIVDYYQTVERTMGGRQSTADFFRLFLLPGVTHCSGGKGADSADFLTALEDWVERGRAPDAILTAHAQPQTIAFSERYPYRDFPREDADVAFTRPIYPYPSYFKYKGHGDPKDAMNFYEVESNATTR